MEESQPLGPDNRQFGIKIVDHKELCQPPDRGSFRGRSCRCLSWLWNRTFGKIAEDWLFLLLLGLSMAFISLFMDYGIAICNKARIFLYRDLTDTRPGLQYLGWIWLPLFLILFSTGFTKLLAPQAAGSGIPEIKTILLGIVIKAHFSLKAFIVKVICLTATLATGLPVGKEGPYVHISSMAAILLSKATTSFRGLYAIRSRHMEMLAAACAVGVATAFSTPLGGVLFSIELTSVHFAVRNFWRGFFAAVCATMINGLLTIWIKDQVTISAMIRTNFRVDHPYAPAELLAFALIGVLCGFLGALWVWLHRKYVNFKNNNRVIKYISNKSIFLYPFLVTFAYTTLTFPLGLGMFVAGEQTTHEQLCDLFSDFSWQTETPTVQQFQTINNWQSPYTGVIFNLFAFVVFTYFWAIVASTIPVPAGLFIPTFKLGAGFGRMIGESLSAIFPNGVTPGSSPVVPGGYAMAGAAAFAGAVTHTVSSSVIAFEMTGQLGYCVPVMIAVLIANGISQALQPSIFDSIIKMKKYPYLPNIASSQSKAHDIFVEDFMERDVKFVYHGMTYQQLKSTCVENKSIQNFPLVDSKDSMILLGSAARKNLELLIDDLLSLKNKRHFFYHWKETAEKSLEPLFAEVKALSEKEGLTNALLNMNTIHSLTLHPEEHYIPIGLDNRRRSSRFSVTRVDGPMTPPKDIVVSRAESPMVPEEGQWYGQIEEEPATPTVESVFLPETQQIERLSSDVNTLAIPPSNSLTLPVWAYPKSILKKTNSFTYEHGRLGLKSPYTTVHASDLRGLKKSLGLWKPKSLLKIDAKANSRISFAEGQTGNIPSQFIMSIIKNEEANWEAKELEKLVDFVNCEINPAPHQLVERTNLLQVHSIFSLLGLNQAYVTAIGRLIGIVTLSQLRKVIEEANTGELTKTSISGKQS